MQLEKLLAFNLFAHVLCCMSLKKPSFKSLARFDFVSRLVFFAFFFFFFFFFDGLLVFLEREKKRKIILKMQKNQIIKHALCYAKHQR